MGWGNKGVGAGREAPEVRGVGAGAHGEFAGWESLRGTGGARGRVR